MNKKTLYIVIAIVIIVLVGGGLILVNGMSSNSNTTTTETNPTALNSDLPTATPNSTVQPVATTQGTSQTFTVEGGDFFFKPNEIRVKKGDTVKIIFNNSNGVHDFVIDEFNVRTKTIPDGESDTIEFVADKAGSFEYYCSVSNHRRLGMKGTLIVE
ncbi:MAG TPA: cupredoxin domain-containing protein [Patescibacteria group bacterium]